MLMMSVKQYVGAARRFSPGGRAVTRAVSVRYLTSDGYLHKTVIPTYKFQDSLPRLPVPKLDESLDNFLYAAEPLLSPEELDVARAEVEEFKAGAATGLQTELEARAKAKYTSFISEWWFDMYLESRDALMLNVNPQLAFQDDPVAEKNDQAERTASLLVSAARFIRTLRDEHLEPDLFELKPETTQTAWFKTLIKWFPRQLAFYAGVPFGAYALDMSQYGGLIASTRVPRPGKDELLKSHGTTHVVIQRGHHFYTVDILRPNGDAVPPAEVKAAVEAILAAPLDQDSPPLGVLTSAGRDDWATAREGLVSDATNAASLSQIDSALFAVTLEHSAPEDFAAINRLMLHGDGRNRWFDKSFQLIVADNGKSAINFEHAWGDGVAVLRFFNEVFKDSVASPLIGAVDDQQVEVTAAEPLAWNLTPEDEAAISAACKAADDLIDSVDLAVVETPELGSQWIKDNKLSPDGLLQMCFQLGHYRMYGRLGATYESASTAAFKHGRTETIRSATPEALAMCKIICDDAAGAADRADAIRVAVKNHSRITKDALSGKGWDRHFFALRKLAELAEKEGGDKVPSIFTGHAYSTLSEIILSTSTLSSPALDAGGFGPVGPKCYAIGYGVRDAGARFYVMSNHLRTEEFANALLAGAREIRDIIEEAAAASESGDGK